MPEPVTGAHAPPRALASALFVGSFLPFSETFVLDQLQRQRRFRAHVFARRLLAAGENLRYRDLTALTALEGVAWFHTGRSATFRRAFELLRPVLVHAHFGINGVLAEPLARRAGVPLVVSFHGHDVGGLFPQNRYHPRYHRYQRLAPAMFETASLLICASQDLADTLVNECGAPEGKVWVHHLGTDVSRPPVPRPEGFQVAMVGRLVEKKGMHFGIQAFAEVVRRFPEARLSIVGEGPLRRPLERAVRELSLGASVRFLGSLASAGVRDLLDRSHVILTPSVTTSALDRESGVLVLKEAGAAGLPAVATRHGGIPEIVEHERTGLLAPERDVRELAASLCLLAEDPARREAMGRAARARIVAHFDTVRQNQVLEERLGALLGGSGGERGAP